MSSRTLVAYFSRPGENYFYGDRTQLATGNTEVVAHLIADRLGADLYKIEPAEPYSDDYDTTVARNVWEQDTNARPEIARVLPDPTGYDVIVLGSPIWNVRPPMVMHTFLDGFDLTGKRLYPFTTHAMSGLGSAEREYAEAARGAAVGEGLAVQGETATDSADDVDAWLGRIGLLEDDAT